MLCEAEQIEIYDVVAAVMISPQRAKQLNIVIRRSADVRSHHGAMFLAVIERCVLDLSLLPSKRGYAENDTARIAARIFFENARSNLGELCDLVGLNCEYVRNLVLAELQKASAA